jgi:hypothetical protein
MKSSKIKFEEDTKIKFEEDTKKMVWWNLLERIIHYVHLTFSLMVDVVHS